MGLKDKMKLAMERANAGRSAKLAAKSDIAAEQGNMKKAAKLDVKSRKVALRGEMREARNTPKLGTMNNPMMSKGINNPTLEDKLKKGYIK